MTAGLVGTETSVNVYACTYMFAITMRERSYEGESMGEVHGFGGKEGKGEML